MISINTNHPTHFENATSVANHLKMFNLWPLWNFAKNLIQEKETFDPKSL